MTLTRREKALIIGGAVLLALVAYIVYFIIPYVNNTGDAIKRYGAAQAEIKLLKTKQTMAVQLQGEIDDLNSQLKSKGAAVPVDIDHARVLLYLKKITEGRAEELLIEPKDAALANRFVVQNVVVEFRTTYPQFLQIIADLKKNELFSKVAVMDVTYVQGMHLGVPQQGAGAGDTGLDSTGSGDSAEPDAPALTTPDDNVIKVHLELIFYAMQPTESTPPVDVEPPAPTARANSLMPLK